MCHSIIVPIVLYYKTVIIFKGFANGSSLIEGVPSIGAVGASGISSSDGGSLTGNVTNDLDVPPPDLPPLPMPRSYK